MGSGKREGFLRLTGAGALIQQDSGALNIEEAMGPTGDQHIPLFGSDYVDDGAIPSLTHVLNHIVYWRLRDLTVNRQITQAQKEAALKEAYGQYEGSEVRVVGKIRKRFGGKRSLVVGGSEWHSEDPEARVILVKNPPSVWEGVVDPHVLFFTMALKMRQRFAQNALEMFQKVPEEYRSKATLLTEIGTPICTYTRPDIGFDIGCEFSQRLTMEGGDLSWLEEGQLFSSTGEYPIEVPSNIDVERLMRIDLKAAQAPHLLLENPSRLEV